MDNEHSARQCVSCVGSRGAGGGDPRAFDRLLAAGDGRLHGGPAGERAAEQDLLFDLRIGPLVGAFLLLAALDHGLVAFPPFRARYERWLAAGVNPFRWLEYSLSASLMAVLIAMLTGIADYVALLALFAVNAAMIFLGWLMELLNPPDRAERAGCPSCSAAWSALSRGSRSRCRSASRQRVDMHRRRSSMRSSFALRPLQQLRRQPGSAVQAGRALARLPLRRALVSR